MTAKISQCSQSTNLSLSSTTPSTNPRIAPKVWASAMARMTPLEWSVRFAMMTPDMPEVSTSSAM